MKPLPQPLPGLLLLLLVTLFLEARVGAALTLNSAGMGIQTFDSVPSQLEWTTASIGVGSDLIRSAHDLDVAVQMLNVSAVTTPVGMSATLPPSQNALARWNSADHYLQIKPAGNAYTVLLATLRNDTGAYVPALTISYDFGVDLRFNIFGEPLPGWRAYYSFSGEEGSWQNIPEFSTATAGSLTAVLEVGSWAPGGPLYLLWADDNATTESDGGYTMDNFIAVIPRSSGVIPVRAHGTGTNVFDVYQDLTNGWSSQTLPGVAASVTNEAGMDAVVQQLFATNINVRLWMEYTWPPDNDGGNATASFNFIGQFLQTRPIGNLGLVLMATLQNETGSNVTALTIAYDFALASLNVSETTEGHRVYYSLTGLPGDWHFIPGLSTGLSGRLRTTLDLGSWPNGTLLYLLWADDNGPANAGQGGTMKEGTYTMDNFVAEPDHLAPRLSIREIRPDELEVTWPWSATDYRLESSPGLDQSQWLAPPGFTSSASGVHRQTFFRPADARFFRLVKP